MLRVIYVLGAFAACYSVDRIVFESRHYLSTVAAASAAGQNFNYMIRDLLRPLGK
jgi:hypothetical protein